MIVPFHFLLDSIGFRIRFVVRPAMAASHCLPAVGLAAFARTIRFTLPQAKTIRFTLPQPKEDKRRPVAAMLLVEGHDDGEGGRSRHDAGGGNEAREMIADAPSTPLRKGCPPTTSPHGGEVIPPGKVEVGGLSKLDKSRHFLHL